MTIEEFRLDIKWWESKRWIYNVFVGCIGIFTIYEGCSKGEYSWSEGDVVRILILGIGANIFYSLGVLLELFDWYYLKNEIGIKRFRMVFFIIGLLLSCFWTLWNGTIYFSKPHLW